MSAELISPELVLVCPDLRAEAIAALPPARLSSPQRLHPKGEPLRHLGPAKPDRAVRTVRVELSRVAAAYVLGRATDLLAIMTGIALGVLVLAAVAGVARG